LGLLERAGLGEAKEGVAGVVDEDVDAARQGYGAVNGAFNGRIVSDIDFKDL
jgi:hypothetical protein